MIPWQGAAIGDCRLATIAQTKTPIRDHLTLFKNDKNEHIQSSSAEYCSLNIRLITINGGLVTGPKSQTGNSDATFLLMRCSSRFIHPRANRTRGHARPQVCVSQPCQAEPLKRAGRPVGGLSTEYASGSFLMLSKHWNLSHSDS